MEKSKVSQRGLRGYASIWNNVGNQLPPYRREAGKKKDVPGERLKRFSKALNLLWNLHISSKIFPNSRISPASDSLSIGKYDISNRLFLFGQKAAHGIHGGKAVQVGARGEGPKSHLDRP